ncbi:General odorant-binding protein 72 [Sergentomyia squamirostris]
MKKTHQLVRQSCQPKTKATTEQIDSVNRGVFPDEKSIKCYVNCVLEMGQTMKRGKLNLKQTIQQINQFTPEDQREKAISATNMCKDAPNGIRDPCEASYAFLKCSKQHHPDGMIP